MKRIATTTIDDLGRLSFPSEIRSMLGWPTGSQIDVFYADGNTAVLQLTKEIVNNMCNICEKRERLITIKGINICKKCAGTIGKLSVPRLAT